MEWEVWAVWEAWEVDLALANTPPQFREMISGNTNPQSLLVVHLFVLVYAAVSSPLQKLESIKRKKSKVCRIVVRAQNGYAHEDSVNVQCHVLV